MAGVKRRLDFDHPGLGSICIQIVMSCAGSCVAWHLDAISTFGHLLLMGVILQPVFLWVSPCAIPWWFLMLGKA